MDEIIKLKEEGNKLFKEQKWYDSINYYTKAIKLLKNSNNDNCNELAILLKNRAAAYLKLNNNENALNDCNDCLKIINNDQKALYRRCQAFENLKLYEDAYNDATIIFKDDPTNKLIQPILKRLYKIIDEKQTNNSKLTSKLNTMIKLTFDLNELNDKRLKAINNLLILSRDNTANNILINNHNFLNNLKNLIKFEKNNEIQLIGIRILGELFKKIDDKNFNKLFELFNIIWFIELFNLNKNNNYEQINAIQYCIQTILNSLSGMNNTPDSKPIKELCEKNQLIIDEILTNLVNNINNPIISGLGRDVIIELLIKNIHYNTLSWAEKLINLNGIEKLLECISELNEYKYESSINITESTKIISSVCLGRIYENMYYDKAKENYLNKINNFISNKLIQPDIESKVRVTVIITELLRGPLDIGNTIISKDGILEMVLVMANSDDYLQQKVACECIIGAASKADKAKAIITQGIDILKKLYKSVDDNIKVRALVGLCKLGSSGGSDITKKPFSDGSNIKLYEACRKFLLYPDKNLDIRKWAAEGLSYLTLDGDVKEKLINDPASLQSLIELGKSGNQSCLFGVVTTLVNLCNAYEKQEIIPEMIELAKFAKQHIPQESTFDDNDFVTKRIIILGKSNVVTALVSLSKTESNNSRELIGRVLNSLASEQELRGLIVQQGGVKLLIKIAHDSTDKGKRQASQALARIAITMDPEVAFPGQRSLEIIRPLINLLHPDCSGLENFEALMGLCNIAQMNETARQRIINEGGLSKIEHYMYEDHQYLCRAATQCITNLSMSPDVVQVYEGNNDRIKYLVSLILDEDIDTAMAASGALAILTGASKRCCEKYFDSKNWLDSLHCLLANTVVSMQYRGVCIVRNIIENSKECTEKLMETDIMEILMALTKLIDNNDDNDNNKQKIIQISEDALKLAANWGVITKT